ncbi:MAG TPA: hypothetical protein ENN13_05605 [Candidatus Altiarchaeales archaeon]|nr:hypothetical protein [Candidatus Altiarchaeales archaeon]
MAGITGQQFDILKAIYEIELKRENANPKRILGEFERIHGKPIKRQNLFTQLKPLLDLNIVERKDKAVYGVNTRVMQNILGERRKKFEADLEDFTVFSDSLDEIMERITLEPKKPEVQFLNPSELFDSIARSIEDAGVFYGDTRFPNISYLNTIFRGFNQSEFVRMQVRKCFETGTLRINVLTSFEVEIPFEQAMKVYKDVEIAYKECSMVMGKLERQVESFKKLDIRYLKPLPGPHMYIVESRENTPVQVFLCLRSDGRGGVQKKVRKPYPGIKIVSQEIAESAKSIFMESFEAAEKVRGAKGKKIINRVWERLDEVYGEKKRLR